MRKYSVCSVICVQTPVDEQVDGQAGWWVGRRAAGGWIDGGVEGWVDGKKEGREVGQEMMD